MNRLLHSQKVAPYVFVLPFIVSFLLFFVYPVFSTIQMSFQEVLPGATRYVGLENFMDLNNRHFYRAVLNSTIYTILTLIVLIPLPLLLATLLNLKAMPFANFFKSALFIPSLTSVVVAGTIFRLMFAESDRSLMNRFVGWFGIPPQHWLGSSVTVMISLVILATWRWIGINILYFLAGLQSIPNELYEAADIDGASPWQKFLHITVPLLKPVTIYVLTISIYGGYAMFTESFMLFSGKPSPKDMGLTIVGYIYYEGLAKFNLGFGSAVGLTLLALTFTVNIIQLKISGMFRKED
jgi:arabinosaccharide transport system permease protein